MTTFAKDQLLAPSPTYQFEIAYLQLCQLSYLADPITAIPANIGNVQPFDPGGYWSVGWGPVQDWSKANLVYVATLYSGSGLPILAAVVIRGTDLDTLDIWSILKQAFEDLSVPFQSNLPWMPSDSPIQVADGTLVGLRTIQDLVDTNNVSVLTFLENFLGNPANGGPLLVVTGHSLGGCLATVVAPWLQEALAATGLTTPIVPTTFAGPTAGNQAFADYYASRFRYCPRYFNSLDIVPFAWWNLTGLADIYDSFGLDLPIELYGILLGFESAMSLAGASYAQPPTNNARLRGIFNVAYAQDWESQASWQHHSTTYMTLLGGKSLITEDATEFLALAAGRRPRSNRTLPNKDLLRRLAQRRV